MVREALNCVRLLGVGALAGKPSRKGAGVGGADELMAVVSSQSKQALTVQGKG